MDFAKVVFKDKNGRVQEVSTGDLMPFDSTLKAEEVEVDEQGQWILIIVTNVNTGSEGSIMIPKDRIIRINEGKVTY